MVGYGMVEKRMVEYGMAGYLTREVPEGEEARLEAYEELGGVRRVLWGGERCCGAG